MRRTAALILVTLLLSATSAPAREALWLRHPAISPDGASILFSYRGDLYRVSSSGGAAELLTVYDGHDTRPVWSPDGRRIAFASERFGNFDVYLMPAEGGEAVRLTVHSADDEPTGFSPGGEEILFSSLRIDDVRSAQFPHRALPELYAVGAGGGRPRMVTTITAEEARYGPAGRRIVFQDRKGGENPWRKHHTSGVTRDIRVLDTGTGRFSRLTRHPGEDLSPVLSPDGRTLYFISARGGTLNVFRRPADGSGSPRQLTFFEVHPVRFLSISGGGTLCFTWDGAIHTLEPGDEPRRLTVEVRTDLQNRPEEVLPVDGGITEMALAPSGRELAFVFRGEIFATSAETAVARRLTDTPEQERMIDYSPDGRSIAFAGEREGSWNLYRISLAREEEDYFFNSTLLAEEPLLVSKRETFQPRWSPDGQEIAYLEDRTALRVLSLESKRTRTVMPGARSFSYSDGDQHFDWSPDGRWFLVEFLQPHYWIPQVGLVEASGDPEIVDLTRSGYFDFRPRWMMGGKMLIWQSDRDGLRAHARTGPDQTDVYAMFPTREAYDRFRLTKEEHDLLLEKEKKPEKGEKKDEEDEGSGEPELPQVMIEMDGIRDRKARLTIHSSRLADAVVTPDGGKLLYLARVEKGHDLWSTDLRTRETSILAKLGVEGGGLALDKEGKTLFMLAGGTLSRIDIESGKRKPVPSGGEMRLDAAAERAYLFEHVWRQVRERFYDPGLHGADWETLKEAYARFLPHIGDNHGLAEMLSELLGELNASHTGAYYRPEGEKGDETAALGLLYERAYQGDGLKIAEVMEHNPLVGKGSGLAPGVIIEKIDGRPIRRGENYLGLLNRKAGRYTLLSLHDPGSGRRWEERVKPITQREERELRYMRWVETRRRKAMELSGGRIGYVHVRSMGDSSFRVVQEEALGRHAGQEALVVDTRFNGGGDLVDDLSIFLSGRKYMEFIARDGRRIGMEPARRWTKPSIVIAGEGNYSDAHCFPWAYQHMEIGKVLGMPVAGTCTFVWWERLQDRSLVFGIPNMAVADPEGRPLENRLLQPDIRVENELEEVAAGRDQQLERAINELLKTLDAR